jgi:hypothetical protein
LKKLPGSFPFPGKEPLAGYNKVKEHSITEITIHDNEQAYPKNYL